jgi:thiol-disulfide isomerase/thioredoxin
MAIRRRSQPRRRKLVHRRRHGRIGMSSLDANPFRQGTGRSLKMLSTLHGQRASDPERVMLVWIYADWCGHCQRMLPVWKSLVKRNPEIDFVCIDGDTPSLQSAAPEGYPEITGFPTLWIFARESQSPIVYRGDRSVQAIENMVHKL